MVLKVLLCMVNMTLLKCKRSESPLVWCLMPVCSAATMLITGYNALDPWWGWSLSTVKILSLFHSFHLPHIFPNLSVFISIFVNDLLKILFLTCLHSSNLGCKSTGKQWVWQYVNQGVSPSLKSRSLGLKMQGKGKQKQIAVGRVVY